MVWVLCCGVGIVLWCGYCSVSFESFVLRHLVITTSVTPRNYPDSLPMEKNAYFRLACACLGVNSVCKCYSTRLLSCILESLL